MANAARDRAVGSEGYLIPTTHAKSCMWPEGALTCKLLKGGAKIDCASQVHWMSVKNASLCCHRCVRDCGNISVVLAAKMRLVKWCQGRDKVRCRDNWGNPGVCRGSPWGGKNGARPATMPESEWTLIKDRTPKKDFPTTAAEGTGCAIQGRSNVEIVLRGTH